MLARQFATLLVSFYLSVYRLFVGWRQRRNLGIKGFGGIDERLSLVFRILCQRELFAGRFKLRSAVIHRLTGEPKFSLTVTDRFLH